MCNDFSEGCRYDTKSKKPVSTGYPLEEPLDLPFPTHKREWWLDSNAGQICGCQERGEVRRNVSSNPKGQLDCRHY